jgi:hypothetical protein
MKECAHCSYSRGNTMLLYVIARVAKPIATATLPNAMVVMTEELDNDKTAMIAKTAAAAAHIAAGFFVGGAACFDSAISWGGFPSVGPKSPAS